LENHALNQKLFRVQKDTKTKYQDVEVHDLIMMLSFPILSLSVNFHNTEKNIKFQIEFDRLGLYKVRWKIMH